MKASFTLAFFKRTNIVRDLRRGIRKTGFHAVALLVYIFIYFFFGLDTLFLKQRLNFVFARKTFQDPCVYCVCVQQTYTMTGYITVIVSWRPRKQYD